jgi:hypothetical protein
MLGDFMWLSLPSVAIGRGARSLTVATGKMTARDVAEWGHRSRPDGAKLIHQPSIAG